MALAATADVFLPESYKVFQVQIDLVREVLDAKEKVVVLLRGLPGCGKTTLGNLIISSLGRGKLFSADDYFYCNGQYFFRPNELPMAHNACQTAVTNAIQSNESLIVIANTNLEKWQMIPYAGMASKYGYYLLVMEPNTPWRTDVTQLARRNVHEVSRKKLLDLRDRYEKVEASDLVSQAPVRLPLAIQEEIERADGFAEGSPSTGDRTEATPEAKKKHKKNRLTKTDISEMFRDIRLNADSGQWSLSSHVQTTKLKPQCFEPRGAVSKSDASTTITDLDRVFFESESWDDLALELGFRVATTSGGWNSREEGVAPVCPSRPSKACQTTEPLTTDRVEDNLSTLCAIFPHADPSDLAELLRVTIGDVEWAVDIFLQSGYASGLSCDRPVARQEVEEIEHESHSSSSSYGSVSPTTSSPDTPLAQGDSNTPKLSLSLEFLRAAHKRFGDQFSTEGLDIESLPSELYETWEPPEPLARAIYAAFLEHTGQIEDEEARAACEAVRTTPALVRKEATPELSTSSVGPNNVRDIMQEEEMMERINADRRKELVADAASMLKFSRLTKEFSNIERQELMDIFISFQLREDWTRAHLLALGHVTSEGTQNDETTVAAAAEPVTENKEALMKEKAILINKKIHLQEQLRKIAGQRNLMAAAGFYVGEIYDVDTRLAVVGERLRKARVAEQAADMLDLHHFSVPDAIISLKQRLEELRVAHKRQLMVLTGVGKHSKGRAKLRPAVRQFLQQENIRFEEIYSGTFRVRV